MKTLYRDTPELALPGLRAHLDRRRRLHHHHLGLAIRPPEKRRTRLIRRLLMKLLRILSK